MRTYGVNQIPDDRVLVVEVDSDARSLDPACCADYIGQMIVQAMYEPLFVRDAKTGEWRLGAAEAFAVSPDGLTYTFSIGKEKRWSDGEPVVAEDFVFAWRRLLDSETNSPYRVMFTPVWQADEISEGLLPVQALGVIALDEATLQVRLAYPISYPEALFGMFSAVPLPSHQQGAELLTVHNGPFSLAEHLPGRYVRVTANPFYQELEERGVPEIRFQVNDDLEASVPSYRAHRVHITCNTYFPFERIAEMEVFADFHREPSTILFHLQFNRQRWPVFEERRVRQLLHQAIDKESIAKRLHGGIQPWNHFVPKGLLTDDLELAEARGGAALEAGKAQDVTLAGLNLLFADYFPNREVLEMIRVMWQERLGIEVRLEAVSFEELVRRLTTEEYDVCLRLTAPAYSEPLGCFLPYLYDLEEGAQERVIEHLEMAIDEVGARPVAYREADRILQEELPVLPLFNGYSLYFVSPALRGYRLFTDGSVCFRNLRWELS